MALRVNIKRKDARFNGDQPRFYAVVSGPTETMGSRLRRFLELQGLSPLSEEDGVSIWSSPPAIGGPPVYLVPLLQHRFGVGATRDARAMAERAFAARPKEDGLETFLGDRHGLSAGNQALTVGAAREDFVANCDSDHEARARLRWRGGSRSRRPRTLWPSGSGPGRIGPGTRSSRATSKGS